MRTLRARLVLPISGPPLEDGAVIIEGDRIRAVGRWSDVRRRAGGQVDDLGEMALLPGLVNAHCHLDYTAMAGYLPPPRCFTDWIHALLALKADWSYTEFASSWLAGARMLLRTGTTTVADIETVPELLPDVWNTTPLRVFSFLELTGVRSGKPPREILEQALSVIAALPAHRNRAHLSPHAPYSTTPRLMELTAETCRQRDWPVTTHLAESEDEFLMYTQGRGPLHAWLSRNGRDMADCGLSSPVRHLERLGFLSHRLLAAHVNYLAEGDVARLAERGVHVVHCPRSHAYFRHRPFPFTVLQEAGVNVCLGTDSLATTRGGPRHLPQLSLFAEMESFALEHPDVPPQRILYMATAAGACALGRPDRLGVLREGATADLIAVPLAGTTEQACAALVHYAGDVPAVMIDGSWIKPAS